MTIPITPIITSAIGTIIGFIFGFKTASAEPAILDINIQIHPQAQVEAGREPCRADYLAALKAQELGFLKGRMKATDVADVLAVRKHEPLQP